MIVKFIGDVLCYLILIKVGKCVNDFRRIIIIGFLEKVRWLFVNFLNYLFNYD